MNVLITGGCGFIGSNAAVRFDAAGHQVTLCDDLSRPGASVNLEWLERHGPFRFIRGDVSSQEFVDRVIEGGKFDVVIHLAGQVAVTQSLENPRHDFETNALGTLNVLEAIRKYSPQTIMLNASTNKVYGRLKELTAVERPTRYVLAEKPYGVDERQPIDFHSPYGCSKGAADQYVNDYARVFGIRSVNFRQSCIYGYRQFGTEDQGWVAWFIIAHLLKRPITVFGTGRQVRDLLFVDDLVDCYSRAIDRIDRVAGAVFNIGGGPDNTLSILELFRLLEEFSGRAVVYRQAQWRRGDQAVYVSDIRRAADLLGWLPSVGVESGVRQLYGWVEKKLEVFKEKNLSLD